MEELNDSGLFELRKLTAFQVQQLNTFVKVSFEASIDEGKWNVNQL